MCVCACVHACVCDAIPFPSTNRLQDKTKDGSKGDAVPDTFTKDALIKLINSHGGKVVPNPVRSDDPDVEVRTHTRPYRPYMLEYKNNQQEWV